MATESVPNTKNRLILTIELVLVEVEGFTPVVILPNTDRYHLIL